MYLSIKLKNAIKKYNSNYVVELKNIIINGEKRGCSGFVINPANGVVVYVNTEKPTYEPLNDENLYRYAKNHKDYGGSHSFNKWARDVDLAGCIHKMLLNVESYNKWLNGGCY